MMTPPSEQLREVLELVWCQAVDAATSGDFRKQDGSLNEAAYLRYKHNACASAIEKIAHIIVAGV